MVSVTSLGFLPFMALLVCLWYCVPQPSRWKLVLAANAVFCLSIDVGAFFAVALATAVVWQAAQHAQPEQPSRRGWLALGLAAALLPLLVLKYSGMLVPGLRDLYKPFGLAYYSLQLAGYLLDVWHGRTAPTPSYARLWCYAGFFLSLTQGPFNRYNTLMPQLEAAPKTFETQRLVSGLQRSAWGYFNLLGLLGVSFSTAFVPLLIGVFGAGAGYILVLQALTAWIKNLYPEDQRGQFEGVKQLFFVCVPMIVGPAIATPVINAFGVEKIVNGVAGMVPGNSLFLISGLVTLLALLPLLPAARMEKARTGAAAQP